MTAQPTVYLVIYVLNSDNSFFNMNILNIKYVFLAVEEAADKLGKCEITEPDFSSPSSSSMSSNSSATTDPVKRIKNLRKKLRDIEILEEKMQNGTLKNPDKDQKEKLGKKNDIIQDIQMLEKETSQ